MRQPSLQECNRMLRDGEQHQLLLRLLPAKLSSAEVAAETNVAASTVRAMRNSQLRELRTSVFFRMLVPLLDARGMRIEIRYKGG